MKVPIGISRIHSLTFEMKVRKYIIKLPGMRVVKVRKRISRIQKVIVVPVGITTAKSGS